MVSVEVMVDFLRILGLSLLLHLMIFLSILGLSVIFPYQRPPTTEVVEIEILEPSNETLQQNQQKQIVMQAEVPEKEIVEKSDEEARFFSERRQRVRKESQAANSGLTQNQQQNQQQQQQQAPDLSNLTKTSRDIRPLEQKFDTTDRSQFEEFERYARQSPPPANRQFQPSTTSESLPQDVAVGSMTALNTDRLTYYSFYERVTNSTYHRWNTRVRNSLNGLDQNYLRNVVRLNRWVTQAEIILLPNGKVERIIVMKESGIRAFDTAVIQAFKEAAIFPNPPREMIQADGKIHLHYSFIVSI